MSKRMTDTAKWDKQWFRRLPPRLKSLWEYLRDRCDNAGVWDEDFDLATYFIGEPVSEKDMEAFGDRVQKIGTRKWWLTTFIDFQCGTLSRATPAHNPVFKSIEKHNLPYGQTPRLKATSSYADVAAEVFSDEQWVEVQLMNFRITREHLAEVFPVCYEWHTAKPNPPQEIWEWRQKLISWLNINPNIKSHGKGKGDRQTERTIGLAKGFAKRHGKDAGDKPVEGT